MTLFSRQVKVRFAHTDAAGIMFYPRYFELVNNHVEDWFGDGIGFSYKHLHIDEKRAVPTAHIKADFFKPSFMHEELTKIGTTSIALIVKARCGDEDRLKVSLILVHMDMATGKSLPWPDDMRTAMEKWLPATVETGESP